MANISIIRYLDSHESETDWKPQHSDNDKDGDYAGDHDDHVFDDEDDDDDYEYSHESGKARLTRST